jgi:molecular chaperone GrpE
VVRIPVNDTEDKENKDKHRGGQEVPLPEEDRSEPERSEDEQVNESSHESYSEEELLEKLKAAEDTAKRNFDLYLRSQADMENLKRRLQKEKQELAKFSNESLIKELLPVVDSLEKAIALSSAEHSLDSLREGVELTLRGLKSALEKAGLEEVEAQGKCFDPNFHEAMCVEEDKGVDSGTVLQEFQKGYLLNDRLIRPALVVVSKRPDEENPEG